MCSAAADNRKSVLCKMVPCWPPRKLRLFLSPSFSSSHSHRHWGAARKYKIFSPESFRDTNFILFFTSRFRLKLRWNFKIWNFIYFSLSRWCVWSVVLRWFLLITFYISGRRLCTRSRYWENWKVHTYWEMEEQRETPGSSGTSFKGQ